MSDDWNVHWKLDFIFHVFCLPFHRASFKSLASWYISFLIQSEYKMKWVVLDKCNEGETNFLETNFFFQVEKELSQVAQACLWRIWVGRKGTGPSWGSSLGRMCPAFFCPVRGTQSSGEWTSYWPLNGQNNQLNMHQMWCVLWSFIYDLYC